MIAIKVARLCPCLMAIMVYTRKTWKFNGMRRRQLAPQNACRILRERKALGYRIVHSTLPPFKTIERIKSDTKADTKNRSHQIDYLRIHIYQNHPKLIKKGNLGMTKTIKVKLPNPLHKDLLEYTKQNQIKSNDFFMVLVDTNLKFLFNE